MPIAWVSEEIVRAFHAQVIAEHGGLPGPPKPGCLEGVLGRPQNLLLYGDPKPSIAALAASYGVAIASGHCFPDGNKRVALSTVDVFLQLNDFELTAADGPEAVSIFRSVAAGELTEHQLTEWIAANSQPFEAS